MRTLDLAALARELKGQKARVADRIAWEVERFWSKEAARELDGWIGEVQRSLGQGPDASHSAPPTATVRLVEEGPGYGTAATAAYGMLHLLALGGWSGTRIGEEARERQRTTETQRAQRTAGLGERQGAALRERQDAALSERDWRALNKRLARLPVGEKGKLQLSTEIADLLKFPAAFQRTFGIAPEYAAQYVAERLPPIIGASEELQARVRDLVGTAGRETWDPEQLMDELQRAGGWARNRVETQMRVEAATMFSRGRAEVFFDDDAIVAYRFVVIEDDNTTDYCRSLIGKVVGKADIKGIPPFHFRCRTVLVPVFAWEEEGKGKMVGQPVVEKGWGQADWVRQRK